MHTRGSLVLLLLSGLLLACSAPVRSGEEPSPPRSDVSQATAPTAPADSFGSGYLRVHDILQWGPSPPSFLDNGPRFWFLAGFPDSVYATLVDPVAETTEPLFDVSRTRAALRELGVEVPGRGLPFQAFQWLDDANKRIGFALADRRYVLDLTTYSADLAPDTLVAALERREPQPVRPGLFRYSPPIRELPSPDDRWLATVEDGDLWLRSAVSGDRVRLTRDAAPERGWDLEGAGWSPDGRYLAAFKVDRENVPEIPLVNWTEPDVSIEWHPYSMVGEPIPRPELYIFDTRAREQVPAELGSSGAPYLHVAGWNEEPGETYVLRMNRLMNRLDLLAVDASSGGSRVVISERSQTFLWGLPFLHGYTEQLRALDLVVSLDGGERLLWMSEREGGRRVYLYHANGELVRPLTPDSLLAQVAAVDTAGDRLIFGATDPDSDAPYDIAVYSVPVDGGPSEKLVHGPDFGGAWLSPSGEFIVVLRAGLKQPPTMELRRSDDGSLLQTLWTADTSLLEELGWTPPERFTAVAADGETEIHGMIFRPTRFDPGRRYPVIENIYAGPWTMFSPQSMWRWDLWMIQWLAEHGFVVVTIDGRGTAERGKGFQDIAFGRLGQFEIADHATALQQVAASRPYMDMDRVGIFGHSMGGYLTVRAMFTRPDLYKVGVASAPNIDLSRSRVPFEVFMGCLPETCPEAYAAGDNTPLVHGLEGKLLILMGTHDTHIPFGETMRMVEALIEAGKRFDLVVFPGENHVSIQDRYWLQALRDYFLEHLQ